MAALKKKPSGTNELGYITSNFKEPQKIDGMSNLASGLPVGGTAEAARGVLPNSISTRDDCLLPVGRPLLWRLTTSSTK